MTIKCDHVGCENESNGKPMSTGGTAQMCDDHYSEFENILSTKDHMGILHFWYEFDGSREGFIRSIIDEEL